MKQFTVLLFLSSILTFTVCVEDCDSVTGLSHNEVVYCGPRYVEEGASFTITCHLGSGLQLKWYKDGKQINLDHKHFIPKYSLRNEPNRWSQVTVVGATAEDSGTFKCSDFNSLSHKISVIFENIATNEEKKGEGFTLELSKAIQIQCNISSDPHVNISWFKNGVPLVTNSDRYTLIKENNTLEIRKAIETDTGIYMCAAEGDLTKNVSILVKSKPRLEPFPKSYNLMQDDPLKLHCNVVGGFPAPTLAWYKDDVLIGEQNSTSHIKFSTDGKNNSNAFLIIDHLQEGDRAVYMCLATNIAESVNRTTMVRVKDKLAALWPFLGILVEVAILCTIIFIYEKRRAKQEYDESDTDQNNESKPVGDQKDKDVRQRK